MDETARVTSKGQITIPKRVRDQLGLRPGDQVVFSVRERQAVVAKTADFLELAGAVPVPAAKRGTPWDRILEETHRRLGEDRA